MNERELEHLKEQLARQKDFFGIISVEGNIDSLIKERLNSAESRGSWRNL